MRRRALDARDFFYVATVRRLANDECEASEIGDLSWLQGLVHLVVRYRALGCLSRRHDPTQFAATGRPPPRSTVLIEFRRRGLVHVSSASRRD